MSIADKIQRIQAAKTAIAAAITAKGGTVASGDGLEDFASDIATIPSGGGATEPYREDTINASGQLTGTVLHGYTVIPAYAFYKSKLPNINIPEGVVSIGEQAYCQCNDMLSVSFPSSLRTIGNSCFLSSTKLSSLSFPSSLTNIDTQAFQSCTGLQTISFAEGLETLGGSAFSGCSKITSLSLPSSLVTVNSSVFSSCSRLASVVFNGTPNSINEYAFSSCNNLLDIYVPWSQGAVAGAPWRATNATIHYDWTGE